MTIPKPHFLLFCDGNASTASESANANRGRWKFVLENVETGERSEATDVEPSLATDRCALVSVLRGLESLEQPSRVTLVTTSRYVTRGLQYGLTEWRDNDFSWEHFGAVQPIRNADIWRRIDRTLAYHQVQCRWMSQEEIPNDEQETNPNPETAPILEKRACSATVSRNVTIASTLASHSNQPKATKKHQRIYPDTPVPSACTQADEPTSGTKTNATPAATTLAVSLGGTQEKTKHQLSGKSVVALVLLPWTIAVASWKQVWNRILDFDECLESYLRCMLLFEPTNKRTKHKK